MAIISVGYEAIDRASAATAGNSVIQLNAAINATGVIDTVNIYVATAITNMIFGIFFLVSGTTYQCRSAVSAGDFGTGLNQVTGLNLRCVIGDYFGYYNQAGALDRADTGGVMTRYTGNACVVDAQTAFTDGTRLISANATGRGWQYISKYNGVAASAISKVNGTAMQNISKINGIAV